MLKKFILLLIASIGVLGLSWYAYHQYQSPSTDSKIVYVGWIGPLTGAAKGLGVDNLNAMKLALAEYNQKKKEQDPNIQLIATDDQHDPKIAKEQYLSLVKEHHPAAVFFSGYSNLVAVSDLLVKDNVLGINPINNDVALSKLSRNIFLIAKQTEDLASVVANAMIDQNKKNALVIYYSGDDFMPTVAETINLIIQNAGGKIRLIPYDNKKLADFMPFLKIGVQRGSDAYVFLGYSEMGTAIKQARAMGITASFFALNTLPDPAYRMNAEAALNNTQFSNLTYLDGNIQLASEFIAKYKQIYKQTPILPWTAMQAYDAANILFTAIEKASIKNGDFIQNLRDSLYEVSDYPGVSGKLTVKLNGAVRGIYPSLYFIKNDEIYKASTGQQVK